MNQSAIESFEDRLKRLMARRGLSVVELSERVDVSENAVSNWRTGVSSPGMRHLAELSKVLGVSIDYLVTGRANDESESDAEAKRLVEQLATLRVDSLRRFAPDAPDLLSSLDEAQNRARNLRQGSDARQSSSARR